MDKTPTPTTLSTINLKTYGPFDRISIIHALAYDISSILEGARGIFETIRDEEAAALRDADHLQVIHGDFWAGNIILRDAPLIAVAGTQVFIID
ncbi:hypothetical protein V8F33_011062 [Rhypophila sp. PSN 637]